MVPFDMAVTFIAGQTFALGAKKQLKEEKSTFLNKPFLISFLWMTLIYGPSAMFFYHGWTAWNLMYIFDPDKHNLLSAVCIWLDCTILNIIMICSFYLAGNWIKSSKESKVKFTIVVSLIGLIVFLGVTYSRGFYIGSYTEWKNHTAPSFWWHTVMWANVVIGIIDFGSMFLIFKYFRKTN